MVVGVVAVLVGILRKLGLELAHFLLEADHVGAVDPLPLGAVVVLACRTRSFAGEASRKGGVAPRLPLDGGGRSAGVDSRTDAEVTKGDLPDDICNMPSKYGRRGGVHHARPVLGCPTDTAPAPEAFPGRSAGAGVLSPRTGERRQQGPLMLPLVPSLLRSQSPQSVAVVLEEIGIEDGGD
jgi:hypothetical protein